MILHLCNDFAGSTVHAELYRRLDALGVPQTVYCPIRDAQLAGNNAFEGQNTQIVYSPILKKIHRAMFHLKVDAVVADVEKKVDLKAVKCVHATTLFSDGAVALQLKKKYGIPYVVAVRNTDINVFMRYMPHLWLLHRDIIYQAQKVVFISPNLQRRTCQHWTLAGMKKVFEQKGEVVANGINDYWLENLQLTDDVDFPHSLVYVGKFDDNKNVERLIHAVLELRREIPDIHLDLVGGDGEREEAVMQLVRDNADVLAYHGKIFDKPLLQSIYLKNSIFAMISKKETFGLVYLEAMSQGLRVLFTRGEGIDGLFEQKVGEKVNPLSANEIRDALRQLLLHPEQYEKLSAVEFGRFNWEQIALHYLEIYNNII